MAQTIKTRIQHKHDIEANWIKATNFVPLVGELIIYDAETQETFDIAYATLNDEQKVRLNRTEPITKQRFKFGDGTTNVNELPFASNEEQIQANWLQKDETKADYIKNKPENLLTTTDGFKYGGTLHYNTESFSFWTLDPTKTFLSEIDKSILSFYSFSAQLINQETPKVIVTVYDASYDPEGNIEGATEVTTFEKIIPDNYYFDVVEIYNYGNEEDIDEEFAGYNLNVGDTIYTHLNSWKHNTHTNIDVNALESNINTKLNKAPNGTENLITSDNKKINTLYLPEELTKETPLIYGGSFCYYSGDDIGDFTPTDEFLATISGDRHAYLINSDFSVVLYGGSGTIIEDAIKEGFYFEMEGSIGPLTFGGITVEEGETKYVRRVGNHWEETKTTETTVVVTNTVNGKSGDVVLNAENLNIDSTAETTIKEALTNIDKGLDAALKFGGTIDWHYDTPTLDDSYGDWNIVVSSALSKELNLPHSYEWGEIFIDTSFDTPRITCKKSEESEVTYVNIPPNYFFTTTYVEDRETWNIPSIGGHDPNENDTLIARDGYWELQLFDTVAKIESVVAEKTEGKLDKAPNGSSNLLDENNKINTDYLSDVILGQLKFGGTLTYDGEAGDFVSDIDGNSSSSNWSVTPSSLLTSSIDFEESAYGDTNGGIPVFDGNSCAIRTANYSYSDYDDTVVDVRMSPIPEGFYFIFSDGFDPDGSETFNLAGIEFEVGDWALVTNGQWKKVDNTDAVRMVNGKIGNVVLTGKDIAISTDNNTTVKEYIDSKEDKDTTYTLYGSTNDPGLIYLKDNVTNYTKEVDLRRTTVVGDRYGVSATGHYKFLSGKLSDYQDANYLLFVNSTVSGSKGGLIHVHIRRDNGSFRAPVLGWLSKTSGMEENCIGVVQDKDTGDYALYLYRSGTYTYTFVEVLSASSSIGRTNISYTLYNTQEPEDIEMNYTSKNIGVVETAIKDSAGNDIVSTYYNSKTSRTANTFLAAPDGSNGAATFRKISVDDLPQSYVTDIAVEESTLTYTRGDGTTQSVELPSGGGDSELANKVTELEAKVAQLEAIINNITTLNVSNTSGQLNINE